MRKISLLLYVLFVVTLTGCKVVGTKDDVITNTITLKFVVSGDTENNQCAFKLDQDYEIFSYTFDEDIRILMTDDNKPFADCQVRITAKEANDREKTFSLHEDFIADLDETRVIKLAEDLSEVVFITDNGTMIGVYRCGPRTLPLTSKYCVSFSPYTYSLKYDNEPYILNLPHAETFSLNGFHDGQFKYYEVEEKDKIITFYETYNNGQYRKEDDVLLFDYLNQQFKITFNSKKVENEASPSNSYYTFTYALVD